MRRWLALIVLAACVPPASDGPPPYTPPTENPKPKPTEETPAELVISDVSASVNGHNLTITFTTSEPAIGRVDYGTSDYSLNVSEVRPTKTHSIVLLDLAEGNYKYKVSANSVADDNDGKGYVQRVATLPVITNVVAGVSGNDVTITWTTDLASTSRVEAGFVAYDLLSADDGQFVTDHSLTLNVVTPGKYIYRVVSLDEQGDLANADGFEFEIAETPQQPLGTAQNPILINAAALPVSYSDNTRSTANSPQSLFDNYSPAAQNEKGPEYVYKFTLTAAAVMTATVSDGAVVDVDIHLLGALDLGTRTQLLLGGAATMRHNSALSNVALQPGTYFIVVDSYGTDASKAGAYTLNVQIATGSTQQTCTESTRPTPNGVPQEQDFQNGCPAGMVPVNGTVCVDKYEAMLVGLDSSGNAFPWSPYSNPGAQKVKALSVAGMVPQGYINKLQAKAACVNAGKRLCKATEWMRACRGPSSFTYPYGNTRVWDVCNDRRAVHPAVEYFGPNDPDPFSKINHPCINQLPNSLDRAGDNAGCESADHPFDMMGNLHEWIEDKTANGHGIFKGGYYVDTKINGEGCLYQTTAHGESHWDYSTGFRCCADL